MIKVHRNLTLLEASPELLEELDLRGVLDPVTQVVVTERIRLLEDGQVDELLERLLEQGYMPGLSER